MNITVCVKQVPDSTNVRINPETNTLMREGVESIVNPFDEYALEQALALKDAVGARVTVISMGPPQASAVLREALARGADRAGRPARPSPRSSTSASAYPARYSIWRAFAGLTR